MVATNNPRGFVPSQTYNSDFRTRRYPVSANNPTSVFTGDPVELGADGKIRVIDTSAPSATERGVLGVVRAVYNSNGRPLTHNLPSKGQFIDASTAGFVDVLDDPDMVFLISSDATASQADIGQYVRCTAGSPTSATGISGFHLRIADATASSVGHRFQIVAVGNNERIAGDGFGNNQDMLVRISNHHYRRGRNRVGIEGN